MTVYELAFNEDEIAGSVIISNESTGGNDTELFMNWSRFQNTEEHELDKYDLNDFIEWNNTNNHTQIERVFVEQVLPIFK